MTNMWLSPKGKAVFMAPVSRRLFDALRFTGVNGWKKTAYDAVKIRRNQIIISGVIK